MFVVLACLLVLGAGGGDQQVWLDAPTAVANNRALRLDIQTANPLYHARMTKLVACSAVDRAFLPEARCSSPGFMATELYPLKEHQEIGDGGGDDRKRGSKFHVRQRSRSIYLKRRLLDPHSPTVYLEATIELADERGVFVAVDPIVVRYQVPERAVPVNVPVESKQEDAKSFTLLSLFLHQQEDYDDYDMADSRLDANGTSSTHYRHEHWSTYTLAGFGLLFILVSFIAMAIIKGKARAKQRLRLAQPTPSYGENRLGKIARWMNQGEQLGFFGKRHVNNNNGDANGDDTQLEDIL